MTAGSDPAMGPSYAEVIDALPVSGAWATDLRGVPAKLTAEAGPLARIMAQPEFAEVIARFETADAAAVKARDRYKMLANLAITFYAIGGLIGAAFLFPVRDVAPSSFLTLATAAQFGALILAVAAAHVVLRVKPYDGWMKDRGRAENARLELFQRLVESDEPTQPGEYMTLPLVLELFRRFHLDVQLAYYHSRGQRHARSAAALSGRRAAYAFLIAILGGPIIIIILNMGSVPQHMDTWISSGVNFVVLATSILLSALTSRSLIGHDQHNASRYAATYENLVYLKNRYFEAAREAAANGDRESVESFITAINEQISSEHREWVSLRERAARPDFEQIAGPSLPHIRRRKPLRDDGDSPG